MIHSHSSEIHKGGGHSGGSAAGDLNRPFAESVVRRLHEGGFQAVFAGGCVRDMLLGRPAKDYDVATNATPDAVRQLFGHKRTLAVGASFGVVVVLPSYDERRRGVDQVEVATFRTEGPYLDGRRPDRVVFATAEEDAQRRDFTINGMFYDPIAHHVLDFVGGEQDLAARQVRAIGDPIARMQEDKLRLMRAVRFTATLGFQLEENTRAAVQQMAGELTIVSAERITQELRRMLTHETRCNAMQLCSETGLLEVIFPELHPLLWGAELSPGSPWHRTLHAVGLLYEPSFEVALAALLSPVVRCEQTQDPEGVAEPVTDFGERICKRLRLSNESSERIVWLLSQWRHVRELPDQPLSVRKRSAVHPGFRELLELARVLHLARGEEIDSVLAMESFLQETPAEVLDPPAFLGGGDLIAAGLRPGPAFKELLEAIRDRQLEGTLASRDAALAFVAEWQSQQAK